MKRMVFVQSELLDDSHVVEVEHDTGTAQLRRTLLELVLTLADAEGMHIYVEDDDDEQAFDNLLEVPDGLRVHLHRHKGIDVVVRYAGRDVGRTFRPGTTLARVKKWAAVELGITPSDAAELMLQVSGTDNRPDPDTHVGTLVKAPATGVSFDLVPSPRVNG